MNVVEKGYYKTSYEVLIYGCEDGSEGATESTLDVFGDGSGLVLFRFEGNANDESGNYNGSWSGNEQYVSAVFGQGALFDGSSYIDINGDIQDLFTENNDFTVTGWFNYNSFKKWSRVFDFGAYLVLTNVDTTNTLRCAFRPQAYNGNYSDFVYYETDIDTNKFYFFVATYDSTNNTFKFILYDEDKNIVEPPLSSTDQGGTPDDVKNAFADSSWSADELMDGIIDQIRVFNKVLTNKEIEQLYYECNYGQIDTDEVYRFDLLRNIKEVVLQNSNWELVEEQTGTDYWGRDDIVLKLVLKNVNSGLNYEPHLIFEWYDGIKIFPCKNYDSTKESKDQQGAISDGTNYEDFYINLTQYAGWNLNQDVSNTFLKYLIVTDYSINLKFSYYREGNYYYIDDFVKNYIFTFSIFNSLDKDTSGMYAYCSVHRQPTAYYLYYNDIWYNENKNGIWTEQFTKDIDKPQGYRVIMSPQGNSSAIPVSFFIDTSDTDTPLWQYVGHTYENYTGNPKDTIVWIDTEEGQKECISKEINSLGNVLVDKTDYLLYNKI